MDHELRVGHEIEELVRVTREDGMGQQELGRETVHLERVGRHVPFGVDVDVVAPAGRNEVHEFDAGDLDQPVSRKRVEARRFRIEHDLAH